MENWAIKAIEREAEKRAELRHISASIEDNRPFILGLTVHQILYLQAYYLRNSGKTIADIPTAPAQQPGEFVPIDRGRP